MRKQSDSKSKIAKTVSSRKKTASKCKSPTESENDCAKSCSIGNTAKVPIDNSLVVRHSLVVPYSGYRTRSRSQTDETAVSETTDNAVAPQPLATLSVELDNVTGKPPVNRQDRGVAKGGIRNTVQTRRKKSSKDHYVKTPHVKTPPRYTSKDHLKTK